MWNPARQALACEYCGLVSEARIESVGDGRGPVEGPEPEHLKEFDLAEALRALPDDARGWKRESTQVKCSSCQAISVFDAARVSQNCEFCGSSALVPYQEVKETIRPLSLLPFKIAESAVRDRIREWYASRWFAPNALAEKARTDTVRDLFRCETQLVPRGDALNRHTRSRYEGTTSANGWVASDQASDVDGRAHEGIVRPQVISSTSPRFPMRERQLAGASESGDSRRRTPKGG